MTEVDCLKLMTLLDDKECQQAARFHFAHDRSAYIAAHALVRAMLSTIIPEPPEAWRFTFNDFGKPEAVIPRGKPHLRVNLSHSRGMAAVAIGLDQDLGIDVEWCARGNLTLDLADRYFSSTEVTLLKSLSETDLDEALFGLWTLKEAYIKAVGMGLSLPLDSFSFTLEPLTFTCVNGASEEWFFSRLDTCPDYAMAVALRHKAHADVHLHAKEVTVLDILKAAGKDVVTGC
ncbi:MAG: 4'-phosphopantetheinyl transferase superfamily protein [Halopseudomonas aestusnigri]